jgi:hypothetical protein
LNADALRAALCRQFCADVHVGEVPAGLALSLPVEDSIGDRIGAYVVRDRGAPFLADDGMFLPELEARGVTTLDGIRREFIDRVLKPAGAYVDEDTLEIRTPALDHEPTAGEVVRFISALSTARAVQFWSREVVRSTFVEDASAAIKARLAGRATVLLDAAPSPELAEFPADVLVLPSGRGRITAVFLVQTMDKLNEALMLWQEGERLERERPRVLAIVEDRDTLPLNSKKAQRAINRIDGIAFYRDDERASLARIERIAELRAA